MLQIHQLVSYAAEGGNFAGPAVFRQRLGNEIDHSGKGAETVVLLDMELEGLLVHV